MKAVEVIDLLSSPEPETRPAKPISTASIRAPASALLRGKPLARTSVRDGEAKYGKETDEWFCISDGPDHMGNPPSRNPTSSTASVLKGDSSLNSDPSWGRSKGKSKGDEDFFFLSDDFDTTIDLTDPFGSLLEPAAKKRRITPEPDLMKNTYSGLQKGKGIARSFSDVAVTSRGDMTGTAKATGLKRSKTSILDDDSILFSSSPDPFRVARDRKEKRRRAGEEDLNGHDDDPFRAGGSNKMASAVTRFKPADDSRPSSSDLDLPDVGVIASQASSFRSLSRKDSKKTLAKYQSEKAALQKQRDKARKAQEKLELKEAEKERNQAAKEAKAKEKEIAADLAKVNTLRIDKKVSTPAMIVDLSVDLDASLSGQVRQFLGPLEVKCEEWRSPIANVIKWRRKVDSIYNEELGFWEPVPLEIKPEKHIICVMPAKEFVDLTVADEGRDLDGHVLRMKARFNECTIIYLVEGLTPWMRKNRNIKNRQFTEAVRSQMSRGFEEATAAASQKGKRKAQQEYVDEDMIEDSLLRLQVIHGAQIHHTAATVDTAQWVMVFTQHISTIPYRLQRMTLDTAFCMESGQVKTGADTADTFIKMLQEVNRVTTPIAHGIAAEYPTAQRLVRGFEMEGKDALQGLRKSANKDGAFSDREVGKKISRRLWSIFMGTDPATTDI